MEILVVRKDNIHEVAQKVGRDPVELESEYYFAQGRNEIIMFCVDVIQMRVKRSE